MHRVSPRSPTLRRNYKPRRLAACLESREPDSGGTEHRGDVPVIRIASFSILNPNLVMQLREAKKVALSIMDASDTIEGINIRNREDMVVVYPWGSLTISIDKLSSSQAYKKAIELEDDGEFVRPSYSNQTNL